MSGRPAVLARLFLTLAVGLSLCHCGGDGGGSSSPTNPPDFLIVAGGLIAGVDCACIREVELLVDGGVVARASTGGAAALLLPWTGSVRADRGQHQFAIRVTSQASSPTTYLATGQLTVVNGAGTAVLDLDLPDKVETLGTGQSISWTFSF